MVDEDIEVLHIDQIEKMLNKLSIIPHSRRAQAITWVPNIDAEHHEPPCLQRIWCRVVRSEDDLYLLEMNTHWRSRDALLAAFMNMYALNEWQKILAQKISKISQQNVQPGRYIDISDSYHIYGSNIRRGDLDRFLKPFESRSFEERVIRSDDPKVKAEFAIGSERIIKEKKR